MIKLNSFFLLSQLYWFERQISQEFDRELSLKIDRLHNALEEISNNPKLENGSLAGVIETIAKKATAAALRWFQPEAILRAAQWKKKIINLLG
jgi:hypothetical protein